MSYERRANLPVLDTCVWYTGLVHCPATVPTTRGFHSSEYGVCIQRVKSTTGASASSAATAAAGREASNAVN